MAAPKSLFILWITAPCSSVRPPLTRAWWLSAIGYVADIEPPRERWPSVAWSLPRHSARVGSPHSCYQVTRSTAILAHSFPSPLSHGSTMARKALSKPNQTKPKNVAAPISHAGLSLPPPLRMCHVLSAAKAPPPPPQKSSSSSFT